MSHSCILWWLQAASARRYELYNVKPEAKIMRTLLYECACYSGKPSKIHKGISNMGLAGPGDEFGLHEWLKRPKIGVWSLEHRTRLLDLPGGITSAGWRESGSPPAVEVKHDKRLRFQIGEQTGCLPLGGNFRRVLSDYEVSRASRPTSNAALAR